jgi:membrane-bound ClpP family serine protease
MRAFINNKYTKIAYLGILFITIIVFTCLMLFPPYQVYYRVYYLAYPFLILLCIMILLVGTFLLFALLSKKRSIGAFNTRVKIIMMVAMTTLMLVSSFFHFIVFMC